MREVSLKLFHPPEARKASCDKPSITVQAGTFEHAKSEMEIALGKYVEGLLREAQDSSHGQAA